MVAPVSTRQAAINVMQYLLVCDRAVQLKATIMKDGEPKETLLSQVDDVEEIDRRWHEAVLTLGKESVFPEVLDAVAEPPTWIFLQKIRAADKGNPPGTRPRLTMDEWAYFFLFFGHEINYAVFRNMWTIWTSCDQDDEDLHTSVEECHVMMLCLLRKIRTMNRPVHPLQILYSLVEMPILEETQIASLNDAIMYTIAIPQRTDSSLLEEDLAVSHFAASRRWVRDPYMIRKLIDTIAIPGPQHVPLAAYDALWPYRMVIDLHCPVVRYPGESKQTLPCLIVAFVGTATKLEREHRKRCFQIGKIVLYSPDRQIRIRASVPYPTFWSGEHYHDQLESDPTQPPVEVIRSRGPARLMVLPKLFVDALARMREPGPEPEIWRACHPRFSRPAEVTMAPSN